VVDGMFDGGGDDEEQVDASASGSRKSKKRKLLRKRAPPSSKPNAFKRNGTAASSSMSSTRFKQHSLEQLFHEERADARSALGIPNYYLALVSPTTLPPRQFCSVCGHVAAYNCPRCGMRFCRAKCQATHTDTRCLKFTT